MKKILLLLPLSLCFFWASAQLNMELASQVNYTQELNDIWGWASPDGEREYALVGTQTGFSIIDVTDPTDPIDRGFIPGVTSTWRDIKTFGNYAFVVNDNVSGGGPSQGMLVVNLGNLPDTISTDDYFYWKPDLEIRGQTVSMTRCHNIYIDEAGFAYLSGCDVNGGGMVILDVTDGENPTFVAPAPPVYAHDVYVQDNKMYASEIYAGKMTIYDVNDKNDIKELGSTFTPFRFTHNVWLSEDGNTAFTTDERGNAPVASYDVSDPSDIEELDQFRPVSTLGRNVIPHNVHVWQNWLIISYYTDGAIIVDASRPDNLIEVGNFDTWINSDGGFDGVWGVYPFLPSGLVLATDIVNGLYVLQPTYVRAAFLEGNVTDAVYGDALNDADIQILDAEPNFSRSALNGDYKTGLATAGSYRVVYSKLGYINDTLTVEMNNGAVTIQDVALQPERPRYRLDGIVVSSEDGSLINDASILIFNDSFTYESRSGLSGNFNLPPVFQGNYTIQAGSWGYRAIVTNDLLVSDGELRIELEPGYYDEFLLDLGWSVSANAASGNWERGEPIGTRNQDGEQVNPQVDVDGDLGDQCYMTGNGGGGAGTDDVDNGTTILITPSMDLSNYTNATVSFYSWFYNGGGSLPINDTLTVQAFNGASTVELMKIYEPFSEWVLREIRLDSFIELTDDVTILFSVSDGSSTATGAHWCEAAIDIFQVNGEQMTVSVDPSLQADAFELNTFPNPFGSDLNVQYTLPETSRNASLHLYDVVGREVLQRKLRSNSGTEQIQIDLKSGMYLLQLRADDKAVSTKKIIRR